MRINGKGLFGKSAGGLSRRPWLRFLRCSWAWRMSTPGWKPSLRQQLILWKKTKWQALKAKQRTGLKTKVAWFPHGAASPRCSSRQSGSHAGLPGLQGDQYGDATDWNFMISAWSRRSSLGSLFMGQVLNLTRPQKERKPKWWKISGSVSIPNQWCAALTRWESIMRVPEARQVATCFKKHDFCVEQNALQSTSSRYSTE